MSMYRTKTDPHKRYHCTSGSIYENTYQEEINKKSGKKELVRIGQTNVYEIIQQDAEASKMVNIIQKLAMKDYSVLKEAKLTYVDENDFPKSLMEAQNIVIKAKAEFDKMPAEVRQLFNNSPEQYVSEIGTDDFIKKLTPYNEEIKKRYQKEEDDKFNKAVADQIRFDNAVAAGKENKTE